MEDGEEYMAVPPSPPSKRRVLARTTVMYVVVAGYLSLLAIAAIVSIQVGLRILDAASDAQAIIHKAQVVFSVLYSFACVNHTDFQLLSEGECDLLSIVV